MAGVSKALSQADVRQCLTASALRMFSDEYQGLFKINAARIPRPGHFVILVDAAMAGLSSVSSGESFEWLTGRAEFDLDEFHGLTSQQFEDLVYERVLEAMRQIELKAANAGRKLAPLAEVVGRQTAKG